MDSPIKKTRKIVYKNTQISYNILGNKGTETMIMLHPAFADHRIFEPQTDYFMGGYQLILIDMPGHGKSQIIGSKITLKDMPEILNQILIENDISTCHLIGVSMGSLVAQAFAERYPDRVKSVIIVGGYSIHKANARILKAQKSEGLKWFIYILFSMKKFRSYVISVSCHTDQGRDLFARGAESFRRRSFIAMEGMKTFFTNKDTPMSYPLLIIVGEYDLKLIQESAIEWNKLDKHSQLVFIPSAGHCANADDPNEFNRVVEKFLAVNC
jgi:3-oxoadipate enol-lactonase